MPTFNLGRAVGQVDIDTRGLKDADISLREAGRGLVYSGGAMVAAFGYVVKTAADFEREMDYVQAITVATDEQMQALTDTAIELGKEGPFGPKELAGAFVELAKAGVDAQGIIDGMGEASIDLAAAADIGLVDATEILVNTLKTFNLEAEDSIAVVDTIAGAANASTIDVEDFAYSLRYAGSIAAAVGVPLDDVATALAILGDRGIKGSTGGTSMRRVLLNLQPASERAAKVLQDLGIITEDGANAFFTAEGQAKSLAEVFQILNDATTDLTDAEKLSAFNTIFGARAAPSALILADQAAEGFAAYADAIDRVSAADVAEQRLDNLAGAVTRLKAAVEAAFITAGTPFQEMLQSWVEGLTQLVNWFSNLDPRIQKFILGSIGAIGVLSLLSGVFLLTIGNIVRAIRVAGELVTAFRAIGTVVRGAAVAFKGLTLALAANPIVLIVLAVIALVAAFVLLYQKSEKFRNFINGIGRKIKEVWGKVVNFFTGPFVDAVQTAWDKVKEVFGGIKDFFGNIGSALGGAASGVGGFFSDLFSGIGDIGKGAFNGVSDFFDTLANIDIGATFGTALETVTNFVTELPDLLGRGASRAVEAFGDFMAELPERLGYALGFALGKLAKWNITFVKKVTEVGTKVVAEVVDFGARLVSAIGEWAAQALVKVNTWVAEMVNKAAELGSQFLMKIVEFFSQLPGKIAEFMLGMLSSILLAAPGIISAAADLGMRVLTSVIEFVMQLPGKVLNFLIDVGTTILGAIPDILTKATEFGQSIFNGIIDAITGIPGKIAEILLDGIERIKNLVGSVGRAAKDFGSSLWNGFKDGVGINSPSYIERALYAMEDQANLTAKNLNASVKYIDSQARELPLEQFTYPSSGELALAGMGASGSRTVGTDSGGAPVVEHHYHAPLIGSASIRSDQDIYDLSKQLGREQQRANRGKGKKTS